MESPDLQENTSFLLPATAVLKQMLETESTFSRPSVATNTLSLLQCMRVNPHSYAVSCPAQTRVSNVLKGLKLLPKACFYLTNGHRMRLQWLLFYCDKKKNTITKMIYTKKSSLGLPLQRDNSLTWQRCTAASHRLGGRELIACMAST